MVEWFAFFNFFEFNKKILPGSSTVTDLIITLAINRPSASVVSSIDTHFFFPSTHHLIFSIVFTNMSSTLPLQKVVSFGISFVVEIPPP
jgi:hypothetical protein